MKNILLTVAGVGLLASCGIGVTGGAGVRIDGLNTNLRHNNQPVACDVVFRSANNDLDVVTRTTQVVVPFTAVGDVQSVRVELVGVNSGQNNNFTATANRAQLDAVGTGNNQFRFRFNANSAQGQFLPASVQANSIIVNPAPNNVLNVVPRSGATVGSFYARLTLTNSTGNTATADSRGLGTAAGTIPVYSACTLVGETSTPL